MFDLALAREWRWVECFIDFPSATWMLLGIYPYIIVSQIMRFSFPILLCLLIFCSQEQVAQVPVIRLQIEDCPVDTLVLIEFRKPRQHYFVVAVSK